MKQLLWSLEARARGRHVPNLLETPDVLCVYGKSWLLGMHEDISYSSGGAVLSLWKDVLLQETGLGWPQAGLPWMGPPATGAPPTFLRALPPVSVREAAGFVLTVV